MKMAGVLVMALDKLSLDELEQLKSKLKTAIARNLDHSRIERVELEDVEQWIALRRQEQQSSEPKF